MSRGALALLLCCLFPATAFATNIPTNLSATATSSSSVTLNWTDNSTDEIGFTFAWDTTSAYSAAAYVWTGGANVTSYVHSGRSAATTYYYKIKAEGSTDAQDSAFSGTVAATTMPANLTATAVSASQINLSWTGNGSNSSINGYTVAMNTSASFTGATYTFVSGAGAASLSKTGLNGGTTYYFAIKAEGTSDAYDSPFTAFSSATTTANPTPISGHFYGINAWMPDQIGAHLFYGDLDTQWTNIDNSGANIMRYGGHGVDQYADSAWADPNDSTKSTLKQYLALVDNMQSRGIEPVLQVPVLGGTYTATKAADIVRYINVTYARNVKYWIIGNEPELSGYNYTTASQVASYIRSFSSAMKAVDPTIKIVGPELAWYDSSIMNGLTTPGGADDITGTDANGRYYVDIITFHHYNGFDGTQTRAQVVSSLTQTGGFNDNLATLKARIANCNSYYGRTGTNAIKIAITEANVNYANTTTDSLTGAGAKSFVGGQWWAEFMGIAMKQGVDFVTFWSAIEGSATTGNELGFIGADGTTKRPSYYHFQMMAQNFRGDVADTTDNQSLVKTFASKASDQVAVIIMNQDQTNSFNYTVRLNTAAVSGTNALKINVDAGLAMESSGTIASESTILLVFDATGTLRKKIEYKLYGHANSNLAPAVTTY
ncbi:MAG: fibronectin type III domain-containing protein [Acidobacteriota bacterium]|nr:fibronectin type III domain-containing protein [Acidobacteriota bacterium]